jgi:1-aminocyclopropane-1-carboxylate deaminase/D-cysteine desulfhydrase-like pyridoxal-dependent ACC family enzyme
MLLDPVYTGKAFAGLLGLIRTGRIKQGETVVFFHTGGDYGLFAYEKALLQHV